MDYVVELVSVQADRRIVSPTGQPAVTHVPLGEVVRVDWGALQSMHQAALQGPRH
jgi:hypothetical protein